jgi:DNA-binding response OmpR family regulator
MTPTRILVVNDQQPVLDLFWELLEGEGYEVFLYSYGFQDPVELERITPDLIILDYVVSNETPGWQLLQMLKMNRPTAQIPIIICTTLVRYVQEIERSLNMRGIRLAPKPFEIDELLRAVEQAITLSEDQTPGDPGGSTTRPQENP